MIHDLRRALAIMMGFSSIAHADGLAISYYDIVGNTANELRDQIHAHGPLGDGGERAHGHTDWRVAWSYRYAPVAGGCTFTRVEVTLTARMTLPRWTADDRSPGALVNRWQRYRAALRVHEDGHYAHGLRATEDIKALQHSIPTATDCSTLAKRFDDQASAILEKYAAADAAYDAETDHGRTQGAVFP